MAGAELCSAEGAIAFRPSAQTGVNGFRRLCQQILVVGLPEHLASRGPHEMKTPAGQTLDRFVDVGAVAVFRRVVSNPASAVRAVLGHRYRKVGTPALLPSASAIVKLLRPD
jgi:hypothetical protein